MPERGSKTSMVPVIWANLEFFLAWSKWFPVAIGDQGWNLVISLWPGDKETINGVVALRLIPKNLLEKFSPRFFRIQVTKGVFFLHNNALAHRALATQKKLAYLGFQCLDHPPYSLDLALSDYHLFPGLKKNWKFAIFHPTQRSLLPRRPGWMDNLMNFFWVACKS